MPEYAAGPWRSVVFVVNDLLDAILLGSFFFGLVFSALSLLIGVADLGIGHVDHNGGVGDHGSHGAHALTPLSIGTMLAFLTWFGGVAYLARNGLGLVAILSLALGLVGGFAGGYVIYWLLRKVRAAEGALDADNDRMPGTIAKVTSSIREGGVGEIVYERRGVRQVSAARSATGKAIPRGTEVVVHNVSAGVAVVEPWSSFVGDRHQDLVAPTDEAAASLPPRSS